MHHRQKKFYLICFCLFIISTSADSGHILRQQPDKSVTCPSAEEGLSNSEQALALIKLARVALGGDEALGSIRTLSVSAKSRRPIKYVSVQSPTKVVEKEKILSGKIELDFLLPDKFRKRTSGKRFRGDFPFSYFEIVNGERAWRNPPLRAISSNKDRRVIDVGDFERTVELQRRGARQQLTIYSLGLLLQSIPSFPLQYCYLGRVRSTEGEEANAIRVTDPENNQMFLLLDPKTNMPLSFAWTFVARLQKPIIMENVGFYDAKFTRATHQRALQEARARAVPPENGEMQMKFYDYRPISRVLLPHRITTKINKEIIEELTFNDFEINHSISQKKFEGEPEPKY
jgi:hypothetical protein